MKHLFLGLMFLPVALLLLVSTPCKAQDITGSWYGVLDVRVARLRLVLNVTKTDKGYSSMLDSPDQGAKGIPVDATSFENNKLTFSISKLGVTYTGTYIPDSAAISGTFVQGGGSFTLKLSRNEQKESKTTSARPQDPQTFPYKQEEIQFASMKDGSTLSGTLTMPSSGKPSKIVILVSGSGPQDRNEEIAQFNHRPFLVWSDWLTRNGIAVIRYDDRGIGKSTGNFSSATTADFADDAEGAVNYILSRPDLKNLSIGIMGHSEGGMIAPIVAARNKAVKFLVLLSAPGIPISELVVQQLEDQMRLMKADQKTVDSQLEMSRLLYSSIKQYHALAPAEFKKKLDSALSAYLTLHPENVPQKMSVQEAVEKSTAAVTTPWWVYFINFNPDDYLSKVRCPVLAINGTLDSQVRYLPNQEGIRTSLQKAGNKSVEIVPLPQLNHLLQKASTGSVVEYSQIEETVNPQALTKVSEWISKLK